jgi:uncharacterized protein DUF4404
MMNSLQSLREQIEQLDAEIRSTETVDDTGREILHRLQDDLQDLLSRSGEDAPPPDLSVTGRLRQAMQHFEITHPNLVAMMESVVNTLSEMGI